MGTKYDTVLGKLREDDTVTSLAGSAVTYDNTASGLAATDVQSAIDEIDATVDMISGGVTYKGAYNAATNTPDLDVAPAGILKGYMYKVSVAGLFFTEEVGIGDTLISDIDNPTTLGDWTVLQANLEGTIAVDAVQYNSAFSQPAHAEGLSFYDQAHKALSYYNDIADASMQIGHEMWIRVNNDTGAQINNGSVVYITGEAGGLPTIALAQADNPVTAGSAIGIATHDIGIGANGVVTSFGDVRDFDTSLLTAGAPVYLSDSVAGGLTSTRPDFPSYVISIGICTVSNALTGEVSVSNIGTNEDILVNSYNGAILESADFTVASDGVNILGTLQRVSGGDLTLMFSDGFTVYDTSPPVTVALLAGTDDAEQINYVFIPKSTKVITVNQTGFPATEHAPIATVLCQSAASLQTDKAYKVHVWTDHVATAGDNGHLSHINAWIRSRPASVISGMATGTTPIVGDPPAVTTDMTLTSGVARQLHEHASPAFNTATGSDIYVANHPVTPNLIVNDLDILIDANNVSLAGTRYNLVIWQSVSEALADCKLWMNLPSGSYGNDADAIADVDNTADITIPKNMTGVGIPIARITIRQTTGGGGLYEILAIEEFPTSGGGGTGSTKNEFSDNLFRVIAVGDNTSKVALDVSGVTTATTRTLAVQDVDGTIALTESTPSSQVQTLKNAVGPTAILVSDGLLLCDTGANAVGLTLPLASVGKVTIPFKDIGANASVNNITFSVVGASGNTIVDVATGQTSTIIAGNGQAGSLVSNGVDTWYLL